MYKRQPEDKADLDKLYVSQSLKEQYWKKTQGTIRSALERTLIIPVSYTHLMYSRYIINWNI